VTHRSLKGGGKPQTALSKELGAERRLFDAFRKVIKKVGGGAGLRTNYPKGGLTQKKFIPVCEGRKAMRNKRVGAG